jgi:hypothetical protein
MKIKRSLEIQLQYGWQQKNFQILLFRKDENRLYGILRKVNDDDKTFSLLVIDMKTGKNFQTNPSQV